nr:protein BIC1-like [Ipomoea batatas]GMD89792.1 protein BIC1-like [Ipomoea batatas]
MSTENNTHHHTTSMKHQLPPPAASCSQEVVGGENQSKRSVREAEAAATVEDCGRERLKRHRGEVAGRVWIPEIWGQEELLKDWVDCCGFDAYWMNTNIILARTALIEDTRTHSHSHSATLRLDNTC